MKILLAILLLLNLNLHAADGGLLHQWRFDQAKNGTVTAKVGATAKYSGSANLIKKNGLSWLQLKGTDSRAWVTDDYKTVKVPKKSITVEAWVSPAKLMLWGGIAGVIQDNGNYERGWLLGYVNRKFSFVIASEGRQKLEPYMQGTTNFQDNRWYHVVGTYDSDTNATRLFVNGKLEASHTNNSGAIFYPPNATFELGGYKDNDEFYRGAIGLQEISIYEKALSAEVVAKRFAARKSEFPLPLESFFVSSPQLRWEKRDALQIEWELSDSLPVEISWKRADGKDARKIPVKAGKKGAALIDQLKPQGEYLYRLTARNAAGTEFPSEWYKFDTSFYGFAAMPQLTWKKRDTLEIQWEFSHPLPMEISWKRKDGTGLRKIPVKAGKKGVALIDQLKPQGEYKYCFTAQGATEPEFTSEWYNFNTSFYRFVSMPQLRWKKRDTLEMEWEFSHPLPMEISWERADGTGRRKIPVKAGRKGVALIDQLEPQVAYKYWFTAQGTTEPEFTSDKQDFDASFYYRLPSKPHKPNPFAEDGEMKMVQSAAKQILSKNEFNQGYALILGSAGGRLAYELASQTEMQVVVVEPDVAKAHAARKALARAGLYGVRVSVHQCDDLGDLPYGPYFANLITSGSLLTEGNLPGLDASQLMHVLRPAGGVVMLGHMAGKLNEQTIKDWFSKGGSQRERKPQCTVSNKNGELWAYAKRGKLDGAGDWTHQYGSAENTTNSGDNLVGGDLGILWWGEPGPRPMPDRGGRNPAPLAANGRMFVQGDRVLFGLDAYNGTVLWTFFSHEMRRSNMPRDGSNMVATDDTLFVTIGSECVALDAQTGKRRTAVHAAKGRDWGWLSASKGQLLTTTVKNGSEYKADDGEWYERFDVGKVERVVSDTLVSHDPANGKKQWEYRGGAMMNSTLTVADDAIYFVESRNTNLVRFATSRVMPDQLTSQYLVALDRVTGRKLWEKSVNFSKCEYMLYLVHADDTLVAAGSERGNPTPIYHTYAYDVSSPSLRFKDNPQNPDVPLLWDHHEFAGKRFNNEPMATHHGGLLQHPLVVKETFFSDNRAYDLRTGVEDEGIKFPRRRGCGNMSASNRSMFFRNHSQEIWDFDSGTDTTTKLQGSRTGCWLGMIPSQGLLLAPESSGGCSCLNENITIQTSAAWVPRLALKKPKK